MNNSYIIMYNLELTIQPSYSRIVLLKSVCEAIYAAAILPVANVIVESGNFNAYYGFICGQFFIQGMFGACYLPWVDENLQNTSGLSEKKRKTLYCPEAYEPEEEEEQNYVDSATLANVSDSSA